MRQTTLIGFLLLTLPGLALAQTVETQCTYDDMVRRVVIMSEPLVSVPCEVHYFKDTEAPGSDEVLWSASQQEGYCEEKAEAFVAKLEGWGWDCETADPAAPAAPAEPAEAAAPAEAPEVPAEAAEMAAPAEAPEAAAEVADALAEAPEAAAEAADALAEAPEAAAEAADALAEAPEAAAEAADALAEAPEAPAAE